MKSGGGTDGEGFPSLRIFTAGEEEKEEPMSSAAVQGTSLLKPLPEVPAAAKECGNFLLKRHMKVMQKIMANLMK